MLVQAGFDEGSSSSSFSSSSVSEAMLESRVKYEEMTSKMKPEEHDFYKMVLPATALWMT